MKKVLFISSTGGHLNELLQLEKMFTNYDFNIITEKTKSNTHSTPTNQATPNTKPFRSETEETLMKACASVTSSCRI